MNRPLRFLTVLFSTFALALTVFAQDLGTIQRRMQERAAPIDALKQKGLVGEDNKGFLDPRESLSEEQGTLVSSENSDRATVYAELAKRNNSTADNVGKLRAKKIAEGSTAGIWLQDDSGKWYRK